MEEGARLIRVVLTGSESTGKTTLANELARYYRAELVPEFVRSYAEKQSGVITFDDHGPIARGQIALEDEVFAKTHGLVFLDTDLLSTIVYCEHYFGRCPDWIKETAAARRPDLYILCDIDVPWVADGVRDRGERRDEMQSLFHRAVAKSGAPHIDVRGDVAHRMAAAVRAVDRALHTSRA
jgi:NadR type nicotinamide-nucleotide adenylyltransferase